MGERDTPATSDALEAVGLQGALKRRFWGALTAPTWRPRKKASARSSMVMSSEALVLFASDDLLRPREGPSRGSARDPAAIPAAGLPVEHAARPVTRPAVDSGAARRPCASEARQRGLCGVGMRGGCKSTTTRAAGPATRSVAPQGQHASSLSRGEPRGPNRAPAGATELGTMLDMLSAPPVPRGEPASAVRPGQLNPGLRAARGWCACGGKPSEPQNKGFMHPGPPG